MGKRKWKRKRNFKIAMGIMVITFLIALGLNIFGGFSTVAQEIGTGYLVQSSK